MSRIENKSHMGIISIRTVAVAADNLNYPTKLGCRQMPGSWPQGNSLVGRTFMLPPPSDGLYRGDYLVVGTPPPKQFKTVIPREKRIFMLFEPPEFWRPEKRFLDAFGCVVTPYRLKDFDGIQILAPATAGNWWYGAKKIRGQDTGEVLSFEEIRDESYPEKINKISIITSKKNYLPGHRDRLNFIQKLSETIPGELEIFGYGFKELQDKRDGLYPFRFHLAMENSVHSDYWTEKLSDPILGRCITFYYGATRIQDYFPEQSIIPINILDFDSSLSKISYFIKNRLPDNLDEDIESARSKVLYRYNAPFFLDYIIDELEKRLDKASV